MDNYTIDEEIAWEGICNGFECYIKQFTDSRGHPQWYCGYVKHGIDRDLTLIEAGISIHGGVTYNRGGVIGFDCQHAHSNDYGMDRLDNVITETINLSNQLHKLLSMTLIEYLEYAHENN